MRPLLAPIAPHLCHVLWFAIEPNGFAVIDQPWPQVQSQALEQQSVEVVVQVNGKLRARLHMAASVTAEQAQAIAQHDPQIQCHLDLKTIKKVVYVPKKLLNFVV